MRLQPYPSPWLPEYSGAAFRLETRAISRVIWRMVASTPALTNRGDVWVVGNPGPKWPRRPPWLPKLYACVRARHYWPTVFRLLLHFHERPVRWKFYCGPGKLYCRPDKIVFYTQGAEELPALVREVRELLQGASYHTLAHTASTAELGLEAADALGLYVGADPHFLAQSWRHYRTICLAWLKINASYVEDLPGGTRAWMKTMNLSADHGGPRDLRPREATQPLTRRYWDLIIEGSAFTHMRRKPSQRAARRRPRVAARASHRPPSTPR